ncbi:MAG TPA: lipid II flippase MurJ [Candidatus Sulfotelmatobacter sp.]|jgi:putative peptidoglycan lipid II flippase
MSSKYLIRNAGIITVWRSVGIVSGAVLDAIILAHFGLGAETDALFASLAIPLLITSALDLQTPKILIPVLTRCFEDEGDHSAHDLVKVLLGTFALILCSIVLLLSALAHVLMRAQAPGFQVHTLQLGAHLFILLVWLAFFQGLAPILQSFLFSRHRYLVPSLSKLSTTIPAILFVSFYHRRLGIYSVALGFLAGSVFQLMLLAVTARRHGLTYGWTFRPRDPRVLEMVKSFGHPLLGHGMSESKMFIENFLTSLLGGGNLSVLRYASRIVEAISGVLLGGIVTSTLPLISVYASEKKFGEMKKSVLDAIRLIVFIALPIACWLIFTGKPMIVLLYERGRFSGADAAHTALLIALLTPYVIFARLIGITQTPFYARLDTKTPLLSVIIFFAAYLGTIALLTRSMGVYGFAIASSFASIMTAITMSALLHRAFGPLGWKDLKKFGVRMALVMALTMCAFALGHTIGGRFLAESLSAKLIRFLVPTALGFTAFLVASVGFRLLGRHHFEALVTR